MTQSAYRIYRLEKAHFDRLADALRERGYRTMAPVEADGAVVWGEFGSAAELPVGRVDTQQPGTYRLENGGEALFGVVNGPQSLKNLTFKPRQPLVRIVRSDAGTRFEPVAAEAKKIAIFGARACDLAALRIQERIFLVGEYPDDHFRACRDNLFIVAVNCTRAHETCFCAAMETGPAVTAGFDLALTELDDCFLLQAGSDPGQAVIDALQPAQADDDAIADGAQRVAGSAAMQRHGLPDAPLPASLYQAQQHARWEEVAERCLSCANCTLVCPTCFCHTVEEVPAMDGQSSERTRIWDSCFSPEHGYIHGKNMRPTTRERYRMWLTHKLASWIDQFGSSGCVGCGRCITWCPVGIDIVEEARALMEDRR